MYRLKPWVDGYSGSKILKESVGKCRVSEKNLTKFKRFFVTLILPKVRSGSYVCDLFRITFGVNCFFCPFLPAKETTLERADFLAGWSEL